MEAQSGPTPAHPVETKLKIVLSVLSGESSQAEAARRHGIRSGRSASERSSSSRAAGRASSTAAKAGKPTGREAALAEQVDDLTRALGEAHVELRALKRGGPHAMGFR